MGDDEDEIRCHDLLSMAIVIICDISQKKGKEIPFSERKL